MLKNAFSDFDHCWFGVGIATNFADAHDLLMHITSGINNRLEEVLVQKPTQIKSVIMCIMNFFPPYRNVTMLTVLSTRRNVKVLKAITSSVLHIIMPAENILLFNM